MRWSWRIATVAGIGIYVHVTFLILVVWIAGVYFSHGGAAAAVGGLLFLAVLFGTVVLHELGHALAARRYGIPTRDITLLPIGGVARLERMPRDPRQELVVALAGPAVNVVLALICLAALVAIVGVAGFAKAFLSGIDELEFLAGREADAEFARIPALGIAFFSQWLAVNVVLAVFNLLPAFPMDGGRVLRALLAMRMDYVRATRMAAGIGVLMAFLFGLLGLFGGNPILIFIALFVYIGATSEATATATRSAVDGIPVAPAMVTEFRVIEPDETLDAVSRYILSGFQQDFPVVRGGELVGMLTRSDLLHALAAGKRDARVEEVMQQQFMRATPHDMLASILEAFDRCRCRSIPIVEDGRVVGIVDLENIGELLAIREAQSRYGRPTGSA